MLFLRVFVCVLHFFFSFFVLCIFFCLVSGSVVLFNFARDGCTVRSWFMGAVPVPKNASLDAPMYLRQLVFFFFMGAYCVLALCWW